MSASSVGHNPIRVQPRNIPDLLKELERQRKEKAEAAGQSAAPTLELPATAPAAAPAPPPTPTPSAATPAPSGILPGEEQVQTMDTFRQLTSGEQEAMKRLHKQHSPSRDFEEWMAEGYGEDAPQDRLKAMQERSRTVPVAQAAGVDVPAGTLPPGEMSPLAARHRAAGKPLPEGRDPSHYSPQQRARMGRDQWAPHVPMQPFGGTYTHGPDGELSARAPDPSLMQAANAAEAAHGKFSMPHIVALGHAYGLKVQQYGDDLDALRADVARAHTRHSRLAEKYDTIPTPMGAYRYTPDAKMRADEQMRNRKSFAMRIIQRYAGMNGDSPDAGLTPAQADQAQKFADRVLALANGSNHDAAMSQLRAMNESLSGRRLESAVRTQKARLQSEGMTRDLNNPRLRQGLLIRTLQNEGRAAARGSIQDVIGNPEAAAGERALAAAEAAAAAAAIKAEKEAEIAGRKPNPADDMARALSTALALPPGALQHAAVKAAVITSGMATADNANAEADRIIADHEASRNPGGEGSKKRLYDLAWKNDWNGFTRLAKVMGLTDDQALEVWKKSRPIDTAVRGWFGGGVFTGGAPAPPAGPPMTAGPSAPPAARGGK
jgi:hypothetical protein